MVLQIAMLMDIYYQTNNKMSCLVMIMGNIGTGKTTLSKTFSEIITDCELINVDEIGKKNNNKKLSNNELTSKIEKGLDNGKTVIVEGTFMQKRNRNWIIFLGKRKQVKVYLFNCGAGNEISLKRRIDKDPTNEKTWTDSHHIHFKEYEEPQLNEGFDKIIKINGII